MTITSARAHGSCSCMLYLRRTAERRAGAALVHETARRRVGGFAVRQRGKMAGKFHQVGLREELGEQTAMRCNQPAVAGSCGKKFLGRHLGRADAKTVLEI